MNNLLFYRFIGKIKKNLPFIKSESFIYKYLYLRESRITFLHFNSNEVVKDIIVEIY